MFDDFYFFWEVGSEVIYWVGGGYGGRVVVGGSLRRVKKV